jgi:hypothetical protein
MPKKYARTDSTIEDFDLVVLACKIWVIALESVSPASEGTDSLISAIRFLLFLKLFQINQPKERCILRQHRLRSHSIRRSSFLFDC